MQTSIFDYDLPPELIAQNPAARRDQARLMALEKSVGHVEHKHFFDLPGLLRPGDILVVNDSKVIPARLTGVKPTGGRVEITLIARIAGGSEHWRCLAKPGRRLKPGEGLAVGDMLTIIPIELEPVGSWIVELKSRGGVAIMETLEKVGKAPLPPYIRRGNDSPVTEDRERYQTVYAKEWGAVAAPTAGLHFTGELMEEISRKGVKIARVTLDVGWGSFAPVREEDAEKHIVAAEKFRVTEETAAAINATKAAGGRVIAVGTTSVRAIESASTEGGVHAMDAETDLFILPGYRFKTVDAMVTNFHLPKSSLIMLVAAFAGLYPLMEAYRVAVKERYRFYSYGDAMAIF